MLSTIVLLLSMGLTAKAATLYEMPHNSAFKAYMSYKKITNKSSKQYRLQQSATTDSNGLRRYNGRYMVAVGSYFGAPVGTYLDVELSTGELLRCVIGDRKQDIHTDSLNLQAHNGNIIEFIVDVKALDPHVASSGDISNIPGFSGYVVSVTVYEEGELEESMESHQLTDATSVGTLTVVQYDSDTDFDTIYLDGEVFETVDPDTETFVTYSDEEVFIG